MLSIVAKASSNFWYLFFAWLVGLLGLLGLTDLFEEPLLPQEIATNGKAIRGQFKANKNNFLFFIFYPNSKFTINQ